MGASPPARQSEPLSAMPRPIVIIHGWSDRSASFGALRRFIAELSGGNFFQINLADYVSMDDEVRFDDLVAGMQRAWRETGLPEKPGAVDAVVHSTGGLVIRDWLTTYAPGEAPVRRLLMLAPANFGSPIAHKGRAFYGRIIKGFNSEKPFQTGARLLRGLELASPYAWDLAMRDRFGAVLAVANQAIDWLALGAHWPRRVGWMALVLPAAAAAYLGTLWLVGVRWQQFRRRG